MDKKFKETNYHGILITADGTTWYLLDGKPVDRDGWMNDNERMFLACQNQRKPERIVVSGYTLRMDAEGTISILQEVAE